MGKIRERIFTQYKVNGSDKILKDYLELNFSRDMLGADALID